MALVELVDIARREEKRVAVGLADVALESLAVGGGTACRGDPGTWVNSAVGMGLAGPVESSEIDRVIGWFEGAGIEPRFEVTPFADESLVSALGKRGFAVKLFENVFYRELKAGDVFETEYPAPEGLEIVPVDPRDAGLVREFAETVARGFAPPEVPAREVDVDLMMRCARHPRCTGVLARINGQAAGAGSLELFDGLAGLFGLSVLPKFRRRGIQQALLAFRLRRALEAGADLATISSRPGVATERNVRRMGFQVAYTKVILVRAGEGLATVVG